MIPNNDVLIVLACIPHLFSIKKKKQLKLKVLNIKEKEFSPMTQASKSVAKERKNIIPSNLYAIVHDYLMQRFFRKRVLSLKELKK